MITLEKYKGPSSRHTCPSCGRKKVFTRYLKDGEPIDDACGICDRSSKCGYHLPPREFFADRPELSHVSNGRAKQKVSGEKETYSLASVSFQNPPDYIEKRHLLNTLSGYDRNGFVSGLLDLFPTDPEAVWAAIKEYLVGTFPSPHGAYTCFPYIDSEMRFCKGKLIRYNPFTLKRLKGQCDTSSIVTRLRLKRDFTYKQIFFGEHLLRENPRRPVAIVEAEKTAILGRICSGVFPDMVWLAAGSKIWLNVDRVAKVSRRCRRRRKIVLFPDADAFERWSEIAESCRKVGLCVSVSTLINDFASPEEKAEGFDLADYLIRDQRSINEGSGFAPEDLKVIRDEAEAIREEGNVYLAQWRTLEGQSRFQS